MNDAHIPSRPYSRGRVAAQTADEASAFDQRAILTLGAPQAVLMENAGRCAAALLPRLFPDARRIVGVVGAGNNGGDALVALRTLATWGFSTRAVVVGDRTPDGALLHGWRLEMRSDADLDGAGWSDVLRDADVVIDGMLGTGSRGAPRERQADVIRRLNASGVPVLSLDLPSGTDASTGAVPGEAVRAAATVSFGAPKVGTLLHPGKAHVGRLVTIEIGFPPLTEEDASAEVITPEWARERLPGRGTDTHKNRVGRVLIAGGGVGMGGAVVLAARAAFRAGAGLVRICSVDANRCVIQSALPEAIFVDGADAAEVEAAVENSDAVVVGPGLGTGRESRALIERVLAAGDVPTLLDADALNLASEGAISLATLSASRPVLITPHPGEMARLLPDARVTSPPTPEATVAERPESRALLDDRPAAVRAAAGAFACTVVLKGAPSLVAWPGGRMLIDSQGSSDLAVAGMGDTLAGVCGALLAQGLGAPEAAAVGLYVSGRAAVLADLGVSLTPSDVVQHLPAALAERAPATTDLDLPFVVFDADAAR